MYDPDDLPGPPVAFKLLVAGHLGFALLSYFFLSATLSVAISVVGFHLLLIGLLFTRKRWARRAILIFFTLASLASLDLLARPDPLAVLSAVLPMGLCYLLNRRDVCRWCGSRSKTQQGV